jgi:hypothetical protein
MLVIETQKHIMKVLSKLQAGREQEMLLEEEEAYLIDILIPAESPLSLSARLGQMMGQHTTVGWKRDLKGWGSGCREFVPYVSWE